MYFETFCNLFGIPALPTKNSQRLYARVDSPSYLTIKANLFRNLSFRFRNDCRQFASEDPLCRAAREEKAISEVSDPPIQWCGLAGYFGLERFGVRSVKSAAALACWR